MLETLPELGRVFVVKQVAVEVQCTEWCAWETASIDYNLPIELRDVSVHCPSYLSLTLATLKNKHIAMFGTTS